MLPACTGIFSYASFLFYDVLTMKTQNLYQIVVPFILFVLALFFFFKLIQPVITVLLFSLLLAYVTFPLLKRIRKRVPNEFVAIGLSLLTVVFIISIPFTFLAIGVIEQGYYFYNSLSDTLAQGALFGFACDSENSTVCMLVNQAELFNAEYLSGFGLDIQLQKNLPLLEEGIENIVVSIPFVLAQLFLTLIITFFVLKDHESIVRKIRNILPMRDQTKNRLITEFSSITNSVVYAQLFVAFVQGIVGAIGFYICGVPFPVLSGVIMAFFALIPFFGTSIVWVPASLYLILSGYFSHDYWALGKGIGLLLYGIFVIATIDNILLAKIVKAKANVSPIVVIVGVAGGASMFGILGIFVGPIILPLLITYFETFKERFN
jgi:predicted PurR-regulated permease PerM